MLAVILQPLLEQTPIPKLLTPIPKLFMRMVGKPVNMCVCMCARAYVFLLVFV